MLVAARIVNAVILVIVAIILVGIVLYVMGADAGNAVVAFFLAAASFLVGPFKTVFELADIEGMKGREIAEALDLNINSVYSRLRAARQQLREFLVQHGIKGEPA